MGVPPPREFVETIKPYVPGEQPRGSGIIKLNTNEFPYPPAPEVLEAIRREATETVRLYPEPTCAKLREALAPRHGVKPEQITVGNGSDELLRLLAHAYLGDRRKLGIVQPTYTLFEVLAAQFGAEVMVFPLDHGERLPGGLIAAPWDACFLPSPNPPLGTAFPLDDLRRLAEKGRLVVLDGAYIDFAEEQDQEELIEAYPNVVLTRSFSKGWGLAGLRLGYAVGDARMIETINKLRDIYNVNRITQAAGLAALGASAYYKERRRELIAERERLAAELGRRRFRVHPSQANFLFARHPRAAELYRTLKDRKILVRHFNHSGLQGGVRITVGTPEENKALLYALDAILPEGNF